jgi:hypothetical protein
MTQINATVKLEGSEKQIEWAERLRDKWVKAINVILEDAQKQGATNVGEVATRAEAEINSKNKAEFWIKQDNESLPGVDAMKILRGQPWGK